jgi:hypothetical protein
MCIVTVLQEFHFTIKAIKRKENPVADALSRLETINLVKETGGLPDTEEFRQFQSSDPLTGHVIEKLQGKTEMSRKFSPMEEGFICLKEMGY